MRKEKLQQKPRLVSAGFLALDIVFGLDELNPKFYAGGTCGNVTAGMAFLGWHVIPIARLENDIAGEFIGHDLRRWGVNTEFLGLVPTAPTPIVLEKIELGKNGVPKHRFLWNCPDCSAYFPAFRPVLRTQVDALRNRIEPPEVFFADRVSRSTVDLAQYFRSKGSLIYFEPSAAGDTKHFREMLQICDVLKYSAQRARSFSELLRHHKADLEIETLGEDGLRFRTRRAFGSWHSLAGYEVQLKDSAGSGDWTTVGLISSIFREGRRGLDQTNSQEIAEALQYAQALAALNCRFEGARGAMYQISRPKFVEAVEALQERGALGRQKHRRLSLAQQLSTAIVCPSCGPRASSGTNAKQRQSAARLLTI